MHDGPLDHTLEPQGGLRIHLVHTANRGGVFLDELREALSQVIAVGRTSAQNLRGRGVVKQCHEQVLDSDEFMALLARLDKRHVQTDFEFLRDHAASIMHCNGWPPRLAAARTNSTLVAATSFENTPHTPRPS